MRVSEQCKAIIQELVRVNGHPTANEVYQSLRQRMPHLSLGTVYRNLESLSREGIIRKLEAVGSQRRYDCNTVKHYHMHCIRCGRLDDVSPDEMKCVTDLLREIRGYHVLWSNIVLVGVCPACNAGEQ